MEETLPRVQRRSLRMGGVCMALLSCLTLFVWQGVSRMDRNAELSRFTLQAEELRTRIDKRMEDYSMLLRGAAGLFIASKEVSRAEWHEYYHLLQPANYYPGLQGLGFAERLTPGDVDAYQKRAQADGQGNYSIFPRGEREAYYPVTYLEPLDWRNQRALGYDMYSEPTRRAAMDLARRTGKPALTGPVRLVQETGEAPQTGILLYWPAYRHADADNALEFIGFAYAAFRTTDLMNSILGGDHGNFSLTILDATTSATGAPVYSSTSPETSSWLQYVGTIDVGGRQWRLEINATPGYEEHTRFNNATTTLFLGLIISILISAALSTYLYQRENISAAESLRYELLMQREMRFRNMIDAMPNGVLMVNAQGIIEHANSRLHETFGYSQDSLIGKNFSVLLPTPIQEDHAGYFRHFLSAPTQRQMGVGRELFGQSASGKMIPVEIGLSPINANGELNVLAVVVDISARRAADEKLQQQAEALARSNHYKSEFLANVSHELRTPLNSILILSEQLQQNRQQHLSEREVLHARIIHQSGSELLGLIDDILDLSRIEAGRMQLQKDRFSIASLAERLMESLGPLADQKALNFSIELHDDCPPILSTDLQRLSQILRNLIQNAIKFTQHGKVLVDIHPSTIPSEQEAGYLEFSVIDTGIGLAADKLDQIFDAFRQADGSTSRRFGGSGLGLTISRELAHLLGGRITVTSTEGEGSCFSLAIPCRAEELTERPPHAGGSTLLHLGAPPHEEDSEAPERHADPILIVDDDIRNIYAMSAMLDGLGFDCIPARDGEEALTLTERCKFSLVLMDIAMPVMDGPTTIAKLREREFTTPIVVVTAHAMKGDRENFLSLGADDYLAKPVSRASIQNILRKWVT